ncbi:MAG: class I SAM-dependent methyltransferase [Deltaproteobacteria bacterium]|jgi:SAM-dependent methyltransferase|nr:class I SAM-dependent methyltransferase [Deltaproteobacteria bacterium]
MDGSAFSGAPQRRCLISDDYHQYYIIGDRHVGDYEGMYQNCADPWRIEELGFRLDMKAALVLLQEYPKAAKALDAGAGAGYFTQKVIELLLESNTSLHFTVSDISPKALELAEERLSNRFASHSDVAIDFVPFDLRNIDGEICPFADDTFDLIIVAQTLWGLIENIHGLFPGLARKLKCGGRLLMSQHFLPPKEQKYAADIVSRPQDLLKLADQSGFKLLHTMETDRSVNHHLAALWSWN